MLGIKNRSIIMMLLLSAITLSCGGCDFLLKILQRDLFEEKELFGDTYGHNSKVEDLQKILKEIGYNPGSIDGLLGFRTRRAIKEFQKDYGLKETGYVNKKTWEVLNRIYQAEFDFEKIDVNQTQSALKNAGFDPGPIDGKLGPKTKRAIKEFQKSKGLPRSREIDPKTWRELKKHLQVIGMQAVSQ